MCVSEYDIFNNLHLLHLFLLYLLRYFHMTMKIFRVSRGILVSPGVWGLLLAAGWQDGLAFLFFSL